VELEAAFSSVFGGEFKVEGSHGDDVDKTPSPIELVSIIELVLEFEVEWIEFAFRTVLLEDSKGMCTTSGGLSGLAIAIAAAVSVGIGGGRGVSTKLFLSDEGRPDMDEIAVVRLLFEWLPVPLL
jgi:hypothetical protein